MARTTSAIEHAKRVLRHQDTSRCAQGAVMVAQELLRSQTRASATGIGPSLRSHAAGLGQVAEFLVARFAPGLSPSTSAAAGSPDAAGATNGSAYADIDLSAFDAAAAEKPGILDHSKVNGESASSPSSIPPLSSKTTISSVPSSEDFSKVPLEPSTASSTQTKLETGPGVTKIENENAKMPLQTNATSKSAELSGLYDGDGDIPVTAGREQAVPSGPISRVVGFGRLAAGLAAGTVGEAVRRGVRGRPQHTGDAGTPGTSSGGGMRDVVLSNANSERIAATLCRMRGAALKLGQMLSIQDETVLPPQLSHALERVRQSADIMPARQLDQVMAAELGPDWRMNFVKFNDKPFAAASLGQVHQALLKTPEGPIPVAVKVQFPGVADSIDSDLANLKRLADITGIFPRGLFIDRIIEVMKEELREECDYLSEAKHQKKFREILKNDSESFFVPRVFDQTTTSRILTTELARGVAIDKVAKTLSQEQRNRIGRLLLHLSLKELFDFRYMQTDPNFSNYLFDEKTGRIVLLDFGATRAYGREFVDDYLELVWAASKSDRGAILDYSIKLGFLTGDESQAMKNAHIQSGLEIGRPFQQEGPFDFRGSRMVSQMSKHGDTFMNERLTPPPKEVYSLHRKLSGAYMTCIKLGSIFPCRDLLVKSYENYHKQQ